MSAESEAHVWRHSPYTGLAFTVHLAIGDSANDQYGYEFFMTNANLAAKVRSNRTTINKILARMVEDGWLVRVHGRPNLHRGVRCYRFIFKADSPVVYGPNQRVTSEHTSDSRCDERAQEPVTREHTELKTEPKRGTSRTARSRARRSSEGSSSTGGEGYEPLPEDEIRRRLERARRDLRGT